MKGSVTLPPMSIPVFVAGMWPWVKLSRIDDASFSFSIFPSLAAPGYPLLPVCASTAYLMLVVPACRVLAEVLQISVHFTKTQIAVTDPAIDGVGDLAKPFRVTTFVAGFQSAYYKEHDEGLVATITGTSHSGGADNMRLVLGACRVTPVPCNTTGKAIAEEEFIGGGEDAA
ncbi:hypothetical protein HG531_001768 [Fusarium graminearum]|nr:hypothetical protein HG531_001768 [Fusarium graminearum]